MNILVAGSRDFDDWEQLCSVLDQYRQTSVINRIISGGACGADRLGERYARKYNIPLLVIKPDWRRGRGAGLERNQELVDVADYVFCFWDGKSRGTQDTIKKTKKAHKPLEIIYKAKINIIHNVIPKTAAKSGK